MKPWRELFFEEVEPPHHFHIGMRIIKTVIAVFVCAIIGWLRGEMTFFSMIAAVLCMQKSAEKTLSTSFNRVMGTAVGGAYGVIVLFLETQFNLQRVPPLFYLVVSLMLIPVILTTIGIKKPSVAGFACVVFLSTTVYHVGDADPLHLRAQPHARHGHRHSRGAHREPHDARGRRCSSRSPRPRTWTAREPRSRASRPRRKNKKTRPRSHGPGPFCAHLPCFPAGRTARLWRTMLPTVIISTSSTAAAPIIMTRVMSAGRSTASSSKSELSTSKQR